MLSDLELTAHLRALELPEAGIAYIHRVRTSPPSRNVSSTGRRNTTWRYASQKMGCTIQGESTLERDFLVHCEYSRLIAEFWDQPEGVSVMFNGKGGRTQRVRYTPDVLVIASKGVTAFQVKYKKDYEVLVAQRPTRWIRNGDDYEDVAANTLFASMGIKHIALAERNISAVAAENYSLLMRARDASSSSDQDEVDRILTTLAEEGVLSISGLMRRLSGADNTRLLQLIDDGRVAALLDKHRLADQDDALVSLDRPTLEEVDANRSRLSRLSKTTVTPHAEAPSLDQIKAIVHRLGVLRSPSNGTVSQRTLRRWRCAQNSAQGDVRALSPKTHLRGNRTRRISADDLELMGQAISDHLLTPNAGTIVAAYAAFLGARGLRHIQRPGLDVNKPPSLTTFFAEVSKIPLRTRRAAQGGARMANALAPPVDANARSLLPLRAFERVHIDHYLIDQYAVVLRTTKGKAVTKRAWLTVMIDQATQTVLAISISFKSPSRYACACVLRDCVVRHERLPETIVVDHGSEFESIYFESLLARYGVSKHERPPHAPRFGGAIESTFHSIREELIRSLDGSTSNDESGRAASSSHRGQALANWELREIYEAYQGYFSRHFNLKVRGTSTCSADIAFDTLMEAFPFSGIRVDYNQSFLIATSIPLDRKFTVTHHRGVTHHGRWYFHSDLLTVPNGSKVDVLEDPWDDSRLYVSANGGWITCSSGNGRLEHGDPELRMIRTIEFLDNQSSRREQALALRVELGRDVARQKSEHAKRTADRDRIRQKPGARKLPEPASEKPSPYPTCEGHLDGYPTNRK